MASSLALLIGLLFIGVLFYLDKADGESLSKALWVPFFWLCLASSRYVGQWLHPVARPELGTYAEGSSVDRTVFLVLILAGIFVLSRRGLSWKELLRDNPWVWLYLLYGLISLAWSDFPFVAFKRWAKGLGTVVMAMIVLTEAKPSKALEQMLRKMAFIMIPLSVVFIKYIPHLGRAYHMGRPMFIGVTGHKNALGLICMLFSIYFCWQLLYKPVKLATNRDKLRLALYGILIGMIIWLTSMARSATSLSCTYLAIFVLVMARLSYFRKASQRVVPTFLSFFLGFAALDYFFQIKDRIITLLGREPSLTSRVPMWADLISLVRNPLVGFGYESFWLGERQEIIYADWGISGNAHNGYLEMYLNLGLIGVFFIAAWYISGLVRIRRQIRDDYAAGILRFALLLVIAVHGYTEAAFYGVSSIWMLLFIVIMDPPRHPRGLIEPGAEISG